MEVLGEGGHIWTTPLTTNHVYKGFLKDSFGSILPDSFARIVVHDHDIENTHFDGVMYTPSHEIKHHHDYSEGRRSFDVELSYINKRGITAVDLVLQIRILNRNIS